MQINFLKPLLLLIFLGFSSYALCCSAIPATRTQNWKGEDTSALPSLAKLEHVQKLVNIGEEVLVDMDAGFIERRVDLEIQDYEGTGANRDHDPKSPGKV